MNKVERNRKPQRLKDFDYSTDGAYFVTICTKDREDHFGEIQNEKMKLHTCGEIAKKCWLDLPNHYANCALDEFVVMPNHFHGIVFIDNAIVGNGLKPFLTKPFLTKPFLTTTQSPMDKKHGLSEMVRAFKTFSSRRINEQNESIGFRWQKSFHDRIIRDEDELNRIRKYIIDNPCNWANDENNLDMIK